MSMVRVRETDVRNDRDSDREDRDKRDKEDRDNSLSAKYIENNEATKRDNDGVEEAKDMTTYVRPLFFSEIFVGDMGIIVFNWRISCHLSGLSLFKWVSRGLW